MKRAPCTRTTIALAALFTLSTRIPAPVFAQAPEGLQGTIAYFRVVGATEGEPGTSELHLVNPDGTNDRTIYSTPRGLSTVSPDPTWRPDGGEIGFISPHEFGCSPYNSDIFAIKPDGSGLRRITNAPKCDDLAQLPKGSVTLTIQNLMADASVFFVYVEGAANIEQVGVSPGEITTVTIDNVADLGRLQYTYIKSGQGIWLNPAAYADVVAGQTVQAANPLQISSGSGPFEFRIKNFTWKHDGSEIGYLVVAGLEEVLPSFPANGQTGQSLFTGNTTLVTGNLAWSPLSDEFLYYSILTSPHGIHRGVRGSDVDTHSFVLETDYVTDLAWLPDGSGFLFSTYNFGYFYNEIIRFDFGSNQRTVLADDSIFLVGARPSPDGLYIAFVDRADETLPYDLFGMAVDGSQRWKIASDIASWDWGGVTATDIDPLEQLKDFRLLPNYPNPFSTYTVIRYALPIAAHVTLRVFDVLGHEIAALADEMQHAGIHTVTFDASSYQPGLASGVYFCRLIAETNGDALFHATQTMSLIR